MEVAVPFLVAGMQLAKKAISRRLGKQDPSAEEEDQHAEEVEPPPYEAARSTITLPQYSAEPEQSNQQWKPGRTEKLRQEKRSKA